MTARELHASQKALVLASVLLSPKKCDRQFEAATPKGGKA